MRISVIMPVYNAQATLSRAVDSFLDSAGDYELVAVLDGEQEECFSILSEIGNRHENVHIVYPHKRLGAFHARMLGIEEATGEYCCFLDADDRLAKGALNRYEALSENGMIDIVNVSFTTASSKKEKPNAFTKSKRKLNREEALKALLGDSYVRGFLWTKMIRRKFLLGGFAVKGNDALFEDTCLSVFAFCQASTFVYAPETLYRYTQEEGASAVRKPRTNRSQYHLAAFASIRLYLQKEHPELLPVFFGAKFRSYWSLWYDHTQDRKYGVSRKEIARYKKEFADIFNPSKPLDIQGTSYSEKVGEAL